MLNEVAREEQLAAARAIPTHARVELPPTTNASAAPGERQPEVRANTVAATPEPQDSETTFVPAPKELMNVPPARPESRPEPRDAVLAAPAESTRPHAPAEVPQPEASKPQVRKRVAGNSLFSFDTPTQSAARESEAKAAPAAIARNVSMTNEVPAPVSVITEKPLTDRAAASASSAASLRLMSEPRPLRVGERRRLKVLLKTDAPLGLLALTFRLDPRVLAVRSVGAGTLSAPEDARVTHTVTPEGLLLVTVAPSHPASPLSGAGVLLVFDVEALSVGVEPLRFDADDVYLVATDGRKVLVKVMTDQLSVGE
jgi:hypothetical protein